MKSSKTIIPGGEPQFSWVLQPVLKEDSQLLRAQNLIFGTVHYLLTKERS